MDCGKWGCWCCEVLSEVEGLSCFGTRHLFLSPTIVLLLNFIGVALLYRIILLTFYRCVVVREDTKPRREGMGVSGFRVQVAGFRQGHYVQVWQHFFCMKRRLRFWIKKIMMLTRRWLLLFSKIYCKTTFAHTSLLPYTLSPIPHTLSLTPHTSHLPR